MTERVIIAGAGGQGIMLLGKVLALAAMREDKEVSWFPCYGAEVRGGTAYCMVVISDSEISSPHVEKADTLIVMNEPSLEKFKSRLKNTGLLIVNSSLVHRNLDSRARIIKEPFSDIALKLGNIKVANMVALGSYIGNKIVSIESVFAAIEEIAPADKQHLIAINKQALSAGVELVK